MKPDKGNGIVLLNKDDYTRSMEHLFSDKNKFKQLDSDPTLTRLSSLQSYVRKLKNNNEITEAEYKAMRPQNARPAKACGLPKIHKEFDNLPPFRPIIDTTGTTHSFTAKFLANLIKPLTTNQFTFDDSFDAARKINNIPKELFNCDYKYVSFDAVSLFTNLPLRKTVNIILKRVYTDKLIQTNLKKRSLKKLLLDACTKTSFIFNNKIYEQKDGVSMGSPLGPVLANVIMTELEEKVIRKFVEDGIIKFYGRYVDDTILVIKPKDTGRVHLALNKFDKNLQFTIDEFENVVPHFLDLEIRDDGIALYKKPTNTGLYINYSSNVPWMFRVSWIKSLTTRAKKICSPIHLKGELDIIKRYAAWNGFPKYVTNKIINKVINKSTINDQTTNDQDTVITIWFRLPYCGDKSVQLANTCIKKIKRYCKKDTNIKFKLLYDTNKLEFYCNNKDETPLFNKSFVVYHFKCPGCCASYVGKTERTLHERCIEHGWKDKNSSILTHINDCDGVKHIKNLMSINTPLFADVITPDYRDININIVKNNVQVIDSHKNWNVLLYKEALKIKELKPLLNNGLKASKELDLF